MLEAQDNRSGGAGLGHRRSGVQTDGLHAALLSVTCHHIGEIISLFFICIFTLSVLAFIFTCSLCTCEYYMPCVCFVLKEFFQDGSKPENVGVYNLSKGVNRFCLSKPGFSCLFVHMFKMYRIRLYLMQLLTLLPCSL